MANHSFSSVGQSVVPEARGKAAARDRWLAQGKGNPERMSKGGRFRHGPMKGLTYDQANQKFEGMWTNAPEALKEKYASHARSGATPSEVAEAGGRQVISGLSPARVTNASLNAALPGETSAQAADRFRANRIAKAGGATATTPAPPAHDKDRNGIPDFVQRPKESNPTSGNSFAELTKAPAAPAGGVNGVAMTPMPKAGSKIASQANNPTGSASLYSDVKNGPAGAPEAHFNSSLEKAFPGIQGKAPQSTNKGSPSTSLPVTPAYSPKPFFPNTGTGGYGGSAESYSKAADQGIAHYKQNERIQQAQAQAQAQAASQRQADAAKVDADRLAAGLPAINRDSPRQAGNPPVQAIGQSLSATPPAKVASPTSEVKAPSSVTGTTPARINSLTGLPMGYRPGDAVAPDRAEKAAESVSRQASAPMLSGIRATPQQMAGAQSMMERDGVVPMRPRSVTGISPVRQPPSKDDPNILAKDNLAAEKYQSSFGAGTSDADHATAKIGQKQLYDGASSLDQAKLATNSLKRSSALSAREEEQSMRPPAKPLISGIRATPMSKPSFRR